MWLLFNANPHQDVGHEDKEVTIWVCKACPLASGGVCNQKKFKQTVPPSYIIRNKVSSLLYIITKCSCGRHCAIFFHNKRE